MFKPTPNPPETDPQPPTNPSTPKKSTKPPSARSITTSFPPTASCLASTSPSACTSQTPNTTRHPCWPMPVKLSSASEMLNNFAAALDPSHRKTALGIAQLVMLGELAVNQALDNVEVKA